MFESKTKTEYPKVDCIHEANLLELPNEILFDICCYLPKPDVFWRLGFISQRFNDVSETQLKNRIPIYDHVTEDMAVIGGRLKQLAQCQEVSARVKCLLFDPEAEFVLEHFKTKEAIFHSKKRFDYGFNTDMKIKTLTKACNNLRLGFICQRFNVVSHPHAKSAKTDNKLFTYLRIQQLDHRVKMVMSVLFFTFFDQQNHLSIWPTRYKILLF